MLTATVRHAGNFTFLGKGTSNHWVPMDGSEKIGAEDGAVRPKELVLLALGGCTAFDVRLVLQKRRIEFRSFEVDLTAEEAEKHPMVLTKVEMTYRFEGDDVPVSEVERAIRLSKDTYCSVSAMLRKAFPIEWKAVINGEVVLSGSTADEAAS